MRSLTTAVRSTTACAVLALAAGCSGGGSSPANTPVPQATAPPSIAPSSFGKSDASITIRVSSFGSAKRAAHSRKRFYISPATQGLIAAFTQGSTTTYQGFTLAANTNATTASPATCGAVTDSGYSCTLYFVLPPASYTGTLTTYDSAQSGTSGTPVPATNETTAVALSSDTEPVTIVANTANNFAFTLHAIVEAFQSTPQYIGVPAAPASIPPTLSTTFSALDGDDYLIDSVDPNSSTTFDSGAQPGGPFSAISFAVSEVDGNTCNASPCTTLAASSPTAVTDTATEGVSFSYTGQGAAGDGTASNPPYYGLIALADPTGYDGATSPASPAGGPYAATAFVVPFFGFISTTAASITGHPTISDPTDVSFTSSGDSVTLDAIQYHLPDSSAGYTATPSSSCTASPGGGTIASITASSSLAYGEAFTLSAGNGSGNCTVTLSDGVAADNVIINVTSTAAGGANVTIPSPCPTLTPDARRGHRDVTTTCPQTSPQTSPTLVQYNTGDEFVTLNNPVKAGDTLVLLIANGPYYPTNYPDSFGGFALDTNASNIYTFVYTQDITAPESISGIDGGPYSAYWIGEFSGTSSAAIVSAAYNNQNQEDGAPQIVPDVSGALVVGEELGGNQGTINGFETFINTLDGYSPMEAALSLTPTVSGSAVDLGFVDPSDFSILEVPPAAFRGTFVQHRISTEALRRRAKQLRKVGF